MIKWMQNYGKKSIQFSPSYNLKEIGTKYSTHAITVHDCQDEQITPQ